MGIASLLLGENNPFAQWTSQNQNLLGAIGAGLGQGQNIQSGLSAGLSQLPQAKQLDQAASEKLKAEKLAENQANATQNWLQANHPDLAQMVQAGMPVSEAWQTAMQRMQPQGGADATANMQDWQFGQQNPGYWDALHPGQGGGDMSSTPQGRQQLATQYGLQGEDAQMYVLTGKLPGSNQSVRAGVGQPIYGKNKQTGQIIPWQSMTDGSMVSPADPSASPGDYDFDPAIVAQQRAAGGAFGTAQGGVQFSLPAAKLNLEQELGNIDALKNDTKGREETFGSFGPIPQQWLPTTAATDKFGYKQRVEQVVGQNFLQAYQSLKGAGAITEQEGAKAQAAMARISTGQKKEDFDAALKDLEDVLRAGYARMQAQAGSQFQTGGAQQAPAALTSGNTSTGVQWSIEP